jgi:hypothetical protein
MKNLGERLKTIRGFATAGKMLGVAACVVLFWMTHSALSAQEVDPTASGAAPEASDPQTLLIDGFEYKSAIVRSESPVTIEFVGAETATCDRAATKMSARHVGRNGALTEREFKMAQVAWSYFVARYQEETGLVNAVGSFPSTTLWDTASYISALVAAYELCLIDKREFDTRATKLLGTLRNLDLYKGEGPNKVYHAKTGEKVNYANEAGEVGMSALDIGRMLVWLRILKERHPHLANSVDNVPMRWNFCNLADEEGRMNGAFLTGDGKTKYVQEGRLGYEEYAAKGFALWGFDVSKALKPEPIAYTSIYDVDVPYDGRDPRVFKNQNYVLTEGYILEGLELGWDLPTDRSHDGMVSTSGWRAEFANRIYLVQQRRYEQTGILTARSEHQVDGKPFFVYDSIFADGYAWNTLDPTGEYQPDRAAVSAKAAVGLWALWDTDYTDLLFESVADLYQPDQGYYEGLYENGNGFIPLQTANNNGVILAALLYKVQGPILKQANTNPQVWQTAHADTGLRDAKCHPKPEPKEVPCCACASAAALQPALAPEKFEYCRPVWIDGEIAATECGLEKHNLPVPTMPAADLPQSCSVPQGSQP